jgi:hypothetical protein
MTTPSSNGTPLAKTRVVKAKAAQAQKPKPSKKSSKTASKSMQTVASQVLQPRLPKEEAREVEPKYIYYFPWQAQMQLRRTDLQTRVESFCNLYKFDLRACLSSEILEESYSSQAE